MNKPLRPLLVLTFLCVALPATSATAGPCGDLGPRGQPRRQLATLSCLTAIAAVNASEEKSLRATIERGFREVYEDLCKVPMMEDEAAMWVELYRLSARFYPRRETLKGDVPIAFVNAHHFSLPHWVKRSLETPVGTLIHFDTHSDMEGIPRVDDVKAAVADLRTGKNTDKAWHLLAHAAYRNSMPVTGAVLMAGVKEIIWAKPAWSPEPVDFVSRAFFYARPQGHADPRPLAALAEQGPGAYEAAFRAQQTDFFMLHYDPADNDGRWLPRREREVETWTSTDAKARPHDQHFEHVADLRFSVITTDRADFDASRLTKAVSGEKFVLDIDLDYFVNQGAPVEQESTDDFASHGERVMQRRDEPESSLAIHRSRRFRAAAAAGERAVIERRIRRFRDVLKALKAAGKTPSVVSIADSANLPFTNRAEGQEHSEFVPPHHAYWVRERVTAAIREVYGDGASSNLGDGPKAAPVPPAGKRTGEAIIPKSHAAVEQVRETLRDALYNALAWATAAATTYVKTPHLSAYLLIIHAIAQHGPDAALRQAARAAGHVHSKLTLDPATMGPSMSASAAEVDESMRRILFAQRYGNTEWEVALAGARWMAKQTGLGSEPDLEAETAPIKPSVALDRVGLRRAFASGAEPNLVDVFLGSQATDGGFTIADMTPATRAVYSLVAVRAVLSMCETATLPPEDNKPIWPEVPVTRAQIEAAVVRASVFVFALMGELPGTEQAVDSLLLLRAAASSRDFEPARQLAKNAGKLLAGRLAVKIPALLSALSEADQVPAFAEIGKTLEFFGVDVSGLRAGVAQRVPAFPRAQLLGLSGRTPMTYADATKWLGRSAALTQFRIPGFDYAEALGQTLPLTGVAAMTADPNELVDRFLAVAVTVLSASGYRRAPLDRERFGGEWRFLEAVYTEILAARRPDLVATMLDARRALGEPSTSPRYRDLVWQLIHEQNADGSWGRRAPDDSRLRSTLSAVLALTEPEPEAQHPLHETARGLVRNRVTAPARAEATPQALPGYKPGALIGGRRGAVVLPRRIIPTLPVRGR